MYLANPRKVGATGNNVVPLEHALEWIHKENKNFVRQEGRQTIC